MIAKVRRLAVSFAILPASAAPADGWIRAGDAPPWRGVAVRDS
jgi:hypothetical protein